MQWIIVPTRNNQQLLRKAIESFRAQDIGDVRILVIDNGSSDGAANWLQTQHDLFVIHIPGHGWSVAHSWNRGLQFVFDNRGEDHALVVNNDVELRPDTYRWLLAHGGGFVTAVGVREREKILPVDGGAPVRPHHAIGDTAMYVPPNLDQSSPHPDFSCYLIRRMVYDCVGPFDENFKVAFCEDWDYHVRLHQAGIEAVSIDLPYLHHASQTIKNADNEDRDRIQKQADANRDYFFQKWGVRGGTPEYEALFLQPAPPPQKGQTTSLLEHKGDQNP